jgi:hypothetical protein
MHVHWLDVAWYLNPAGALVLALHLIRSRLIRTYPFFFFYLLVGAVVDLTLLSLKSYPNAYGRTYVACQPVKVLLAVFVILELYRVVLAQRPALARFGRNTVGYILAAAATASLCFLMLDSTVPEGRSPILHRLNSFERTMDLWMLVFLILIRAFMTWFPVRITRNGALYIGGFAVYFLSRATGLLLTNIAPRFRSGLDLAMLGVSLACLVVWISSIRKDGEEATVVTGPRRDPASIAEAMGKLDAINARLTELSRP